MSPPTRALRGATLIAVLALLAGCTDQQPTIAPSGPVAPTTTSSAPATTSRPTELPGPSPTAAAIPAEFPLAVVTGLTNNKAVIVLDDLPGLASDGALVLPCGIALKSPTLTLKAPCVAADKIAQAIDADPSLVAFLPAGLVEPATKVLPIAGEGPFGLFGPDLFGGPESRALPYPITGTATGDGSATLDPAWLAYDATQVWTMNAIGSTCADRSAARQAVTLKKGWDWVFDGGTAMYDGKPIPNPNPPPGIDRHPIVRPFETGHDGTTAKLIRQADVTLGNQKCPVMPSKGWKPANQAQGLSVPDDVVTRWEDFLGIDAFYLPADHQSDRGVGGIRSTLQILDKHEFPRTGLGMDLDEALEPAYLQVAGLKISFVAWNDVPGPTHAAANTPGVAWLTKANVNESVRRARAANADLLVCDPQWWGGGSEYRAYLRPSQTREIAWMDAAGCDQIMGGGLHVTGGMFLRSGTNGVSLVDTGPGNYMYGQDFWQETQEGVVVESTFRGTTLVNVRLHPYVMILAARAALLDPERDGRYVLDRVWENSELDYRP